MSIETMKQELEAAYLEGFNDSAEGYNGEYPFRDHGASPLKDRHWIERRDAYVRTAIEQAEKQEPNYWNVIDPAGNIVATETDSIRGWARIAGSYKPTVEGLLGFHDQGWRVLPKVAPPAAPVQEECVVCGDKVRVIPRPWVGLTDEQKRELVTNWFAEGWAIKAAHGMLDDYDTLLREKNGWQA